MGIVKYSIGIDMSSTDFKVCFACLDEDFQFKIKSSGTFKNTFDEYERFKNWLNKWHKDKETPLFVLVEATGIYHEQLAWYLYKEGFKISVVLANRAKRYLQSLGLKSKNDKIDARGLAQMCAQQQLRLWQPISANIYKLRGYTRLHESLHQQLTIVKNQLHAIGFSMYELKEVRTTLEELSVSLKEQIRTIEQQLKKLIEEDEVLHEKYEKITLIKGISLISFAVIVAETDGFALINNQAQLVSYAGYDVVENQSGKKAGKTCISKKGNYRIRRILHMPALTAIRHENRFKTFYERRSDLRSRIFK